MEKLEFSLQLKEQPVEITDADGTVKTFILRELTGAQRDSYLNEIGGRMKFNAAGKTIGFTTYKNLQANLLCLCLLDPEGTLVKQSVIQNWPAGVVQSLFKSAQELSGLNLEEEDEEAKND